MTPEQFVTWLRNYLSNKLENESISLAPIIEKLSYVNDNTFNIKSSEYINVFNPNTTISDVTYNKDYPWTNT